MKKNLKFTNLRRKIFSLVWKNHEPAKAYTLLKQISDSKTIAKPPTVYRTLDFLQENGLIHKLNTLNSYVGCEHPGANHTCYFLICRGCGNVRECCNEKIQQVIDTTAEHYQFQPQQSCVEIHGLCQDCSVA